MKGRLKDLTVNRDGTQNITITVAADFTEEFDELQGKDVTVEIKKASKRRSLDANAYCWVLVGEIAKKMKLSKNEVYRKAIMDSGVYTIHCLPDSMLETACNDWCSFGIGFQVETFPSRVDGCTNVIFYKGSHFYDTVQMARLIDGLIQEAESLGIPTITPKEAAKLIGKWKKNGGHTNDINGSSENPR